MQAAEILAVTVAGALICSISLTGSVIVWAKLDGKINKPWRFGCQRVVNDLAFMATVYTELQPSSSSTASFCLFWRCCSSLARSLSA